VENERETPVPLTLVDRLLELGIVTDLAKKHDASEPDVVFALEEFVGYWTFSGPGKGAKKRNWPWLARRRIAERARDGMLIGRAKPPGLAAHEATVGKPGAGGRKWTPSAWDSQKNPIAWTDESGKSTYKNPFQEAS
jgi:hypothetical protein